MPRFTAVAGNPFPASDYNSNVRDQVVEQCTSGTRPTGVEGEVIHESDTNLLKVYSGATWSSIGPVHGAPLSWTPAVVQSGAVTTTNTGSTYSRLGRRVFADFILAVTGSGTASNQVTISLPVTAAFTGSYNLPVGVGVLVDTSSGSVFRFIAELLSSTTIRLMDAHITNQVLGVAGFTAGLASGDTLAGTISFNAAADG